LYADELLQFNARLSVSLKKLHEKKTESRGKKLSQGTSKVFLG